MGENRYSKSIPRRDTRDKNIGSDSSNKKFSYELTDRPSGGTFRSVFNATRDETVEQESNLEHSNSLEG